GQRGRRLAGRTRTQCAGLRSPDGGARRGEQRIRQPDDPQPEPPACGGDGGDRGEPSGVAFDRANDSWWVAGGNSGTLTEIGVGTDRVERIVPVDPSGVLSGLTVDPGTGSIYVGLLTNSTVAVVNAGSGAVEGLIPVGYAPSSLAYVPAAGAVFVANSGSGNLSVVNDTALTPTHSIGLGGIPISIAYDPAQGVVLTALYGRNSVAIVSVGFLTVRSFLAVGSGPSGIAYDPATGAVQVANANGGTVSTVGVLGFPVEAVETGLPAHSTWWLNLTGGTHDSTDGVNLSLYLINGTYSYTASTSTPCFAGSPGFFIVQGAPITVRVGFSRATTPVTFDAVGLPTGTQWYVTLGGGLNASTRGTALTFNLTNGSYTYVVATSDRTYAPDPGSGEVVVQGALLDVEIRFAIVTSPVLVRETGLPNGTAWWIRTAGEQFTDNRTPIGRRSSPNGTYRYSA
ncbi:surface antigen-like protein, partial [mine drainage metagenome]